MNYLKGFEMSKKNPRKLRIAVIQQMFIYDDEEDLFEYEDYIYEHIGFVPLSPEHTQAAMNSITIILIPWKKL